MLSVVVSLIMSVSAVFTGAVHPKTVLTNCEETLKTPCVTYDDGKWRKVATYHPYRSQVIHECKNAKGGPKYPCAYSIKGTYKFNYFS